MKVSASYIPSQLECLLFSHTYTKREKINQHLLTCQMAKKMIFEIHEFYVQGAFTLPTSPQKNNAKVKSILITV